MDYEASFEMEELEKRYRDLVEDHRLAVAQREKDLQQAISAYTTDQVAAHEDIKEKELALQEFEKQYHAQLRDRQAALQTAYQHEAACKRKHEDDIEKLKQELSDLKRLKLGTLEPQVRLSHPKFTTRPFVA